LVQTKKGDSKAFGHIVEKYQQPVYNLCYRMLNSVDDAEDAAQDLVWRNPHLQAVGWLTGMVSAAFGLGFSIGQPLLITLIGVIAGVVAAWITVSRQR
jgi:hypothetical protein